MSINNSYKIQIIESDGSTTRYNFNCFIYKKEDLKIKIIDENNNIIELEYGNDYSVENQFDYYNGGYFNLAEPQKQGVYIVVYRETPINQEINFLSLQAISPANLTKMFDKLTIICQEVNEQFYRSLKFDFTDISLINQDKPLNETNLKNINEEINETKIVALTLKYNENTEKWELGTSETDPDKENRISSEEYYGVVKLATQDETTTGTNDEKAITPLKLKTELDNRQATDEEIEEGADVKKYVNPSQLKQVSDGVGNLDNTTQNIIQEGIGSWKEDFNYKKNSIVTILNEDTPRLFFSNENDNLGNNPIISPIDWTEILFGINIQEEVNSIKQRLDLLEYGETNINYKLNNIKMAIPDDTNYTDLTFGASGTEYTAPDDGYFYLVGSLGSTGFNVNALVKISLADNSRYQEARGSSLQGNYVLFFPVSKGQKVIITYSSVYATATIFRFIPLLKQVLPDIPEEEEETTEEEEIVEEEEVIEEETTGEAANG